MPRAGPEKAAGSFWYLTACAATPAPFCDVGGDAPGFVAGEEMRRRVLAPFHPNWSVLKSAVAPFGSW